MSGGMIEVNAELISELEGVFLRIPRKSRALVFDLVKARALKERKPRRRKAVEEKAPKKASKPKKAKKAKEAKSAELPPE